MTLLFERGALIEAPFAVKSDPERGGSDILLLGRDLWNVFRPYHSDTLQRIAVSISPKQQCRIPTSSCLQNIVCWAVPDEETSGICIPPRWLQTYPNLFHVDHASPFSIQKLLTVTATEPINLTNVVLAALSEEAFLAADSQDLFLERWLVFDRPVFRQGDIHVLKPGSSGGPAYHYRIEMIEPVQQGCVDFGKTRLVLTLADDENQNIEVSHSLGSSLGPGTESDADGIEIDEGFFASSVLSSQTNRHQGQEVNGISKIDDSSTFSGVRFRALSLPYQISDQDDNTLYLRTSDLSRVGVLNGDWGVARPDDMASSRLVRIVANDDLIPTAGIVIGSPVLLYNLFPTETSSILTLSLHGTPVGMEKPPIPIASSVTLAIVASPFSSDQSYRSIFAEALKTQLEGDQRLVKRGDIISVGIDSSALRSLAGRDGDTSEEGLMQHRGSISRRTNLVVFFAITDIHMDSLSATLVSQDVSHEYAQGDLGCWLNSSVTRVIQVGETRSRIPDMKTYLGADRRSPAYIHATLQNMTLPRMLSPQSTFGQLLSLATAATSRHAADYGLRSSILLKGKRGVGKFTTASWVAQRLGLHIFEVDCNNLLEKDDMKTRDAIVAHFQKAKSYAPCCLVLRHVDALGQSTQNTEKESVALVTILQECIADITAEWERTGYQILVLGTSSGPGSLPVGLQSCFKHELVLEVPSETERHEILQCLLVDAALAPNVSLSDLATQTAALVASDLAHMVECAQLNSVQRVRTKRISSKQPYICDHVPLNYKDFDIALTKVRASYSDSIGAPKIPDVSWDDVGGLAHVKHNILETVQLPLDHPELFSDGLRKRSGILLYGPPGTGKTLLAKAVATSCSLNFFSVKGPELLNMYIGESEANVRRVFQQARDAKPCVIFFDELDSVAPKRGNHGDSGGVMDRIVSQLLAELDGIASGKAGNDVFVIGATNRPDLLDAALLRPGRFDRMLYLGVSSTHEDQLNILQALTRKFRLAPDVKLLVIAEQCPFHFTGADFYALCSDAMLNAMSRKALELEQKIEELNKSAHRSEHPIPLTAQYYLAELATPEDLLVQVFQKDFQDALRGLIPSISQSELEHYLNIQKQFSSGVIDVDDAL